MTALRFQIGGRHLTSSASLLGTEPEKHRPSNANRNRTSGKTHGSFSLDFLSRFCKKNLHLKVVKHKHKCCDVVPSSLHLSDINTASMHGKCVQNRAPQF